MDLQTLQKLNGLLGNLNSIRRNKKAISVDKKDFDNGDSSSWQEVYPIDGLAAIPLSDIFIQLTVTQDSYQENENITGILFVKGKEVKITNFEKI